ncbi:MAG: DUF4399 domain-containing protein [Burkholderiales bacterium]|nr:DUF4399 domain-containing protein [Burkholderiales bacterium]MDE2397632.1 DUF4399 domain-containing protein [Burkholderiales bacterium]MDE2452872.1 DUF4399 domain-containing protein [Burkholderiales bacterium]
MKNPIHAVVLACACTQAVAAALPADAAERACWLQHSADRTRVKLNEPKRVDFSNLANGFTVRSPFLVQFAVRGMGVVPAGKHVAKTGHHHILIDTPLPLDPTLKIPFSDRYRHFGKGQTSTLLDLPPGPHTLRLLFADYEHRPYFVYSPEITVHVQGQRTSARLAIDPRHPKSSCEAWYEDELTRPRPPGDLVSIDNLRDGESVTSPFNVRFGVEGRGVSAAGATVEHTGHFLLDILQDGQAMRSLDFSNGATQTNLSLANGGYLLRLRFVDGRSRRDLLPASGTRIVVNGQERL